MFQNAYQNGTHFEIFDPKEALNKSNKEKERFYHQLFSVNLPRCSSKVYDNELKGFIFELEGHNTRLQIPRNGDLCLVQQYLVMQVYIYPGYNWMTEIIVTDITKTKRRILLTSSVKELEKKFFHIKSPIDIIRRGIWLNLCIDVWSFMEAWKGILYNLLILRLHFPIN